MTKLYCVLDALPARQLKEATSGLLSYSDSAVEMLLGTIFSALVKIFLSVTTSEILRIHRQYLNLMKPGQNTVPQWPAKAELHRAQEFVLVVLSFSIIPLFGGLLFTCYVINKKDFSVALLVSSVRESPLPFNVCKDDGNICRCHQNKPVVELAFLSDNE
ncbi:hypothetical protein EK904_007821, partial [Melospiza melodia maxima]